MKFEEILPLMREGKRAYINDPNIKEFWYCGKWLICKTGFIDYIDENGKLVEYPENKKWLSLACLDEDEKEIVTKDSWGIPTWAILCDKWEICD